MIFRFGGFLATALLGLGVSFFPALAKDLKASAARMPVYSENHEKGVLIDFLKAMEEAAGTKITFQVVPFAKSMSDVQEKKVDFHLPFIQIPGTDKGTNEFDYSTDTIFHVNFVLYTNKNKPIDKNNLKSAKIETDAAHSQYFDFPVAKSASIEGSIKKVNAGAIDGFIFADGAVDPIIKEGNLKNVKRELYKRFDVKFVLPKGGHGGETDKLLSAAVAKLKANGKFDKIMSPIDGPYNDWQP